MFGNWQEQNGLDGNNMEHLYIFFDLMKKYKCPINPNYSIPYEYELEIVSSYFDVKPKGDGWVTCIFVPLNMPLLRWFEEHAVNEIRQLHRLDEQYKNVELCFDYAQESSLPGNFCKKKGQLELFSIIEWERFNVFTFSSYREDLRNTNGFKNIFYGISYVAMWYFNTVLNYKQHLQDPNLIFTWAGKSGPIRYFCPNNQFRPGRGECIVQMQDKGMLDYAEWNMNSLDDWESQTEHSRELLESRDCNRYFRMFGNQPKYNSYPWNYEFNFSNLGHYDPNRVDTYWPESLVKSCYLYIVNETFNDYRNETGNELGEGHVNLEATEKVWKGFIYGMPMFINARPGVVKHLERLGFDMLSDYMLHDYDAQQRTDKRIGLMLECAKEFPTANKDIVNRLLHNKRKALQLETLWNMFDTSPDPLHVFDTLALDK